MEPEIPASIAAAMAKVSEWLDPVLESTAGYKTKAVAAGLDEDAANMMAVDFHHTMMLVIQKQVTG